MSGLGGRSKSAIGSSLTRSRLPGALVLLVGVLLTLAACSSAGGGSSGLLATYERVWPDGLTEKIEVYGDGRVVMHHGESLERFTVPAGDIDGLRAALTKSIAAGSSDEWPRRTLTLADGAVITWPRPEPDSATELLDRLAQTHSLASGASSPPEHDAVGSDEHDGGASDDHADGG